MKPLRVCILTEAQPFGWVPHYVAAFRKRCEVITAGPTLPRKYLAQWGRQHLAHMVQPNDIETDSDDLPAIFERLPQGWEPDLVVSIHSGRPLYPEMAALNCPTALITIDTWHDIAEYVHARYHDFVFVAQREFLPLMRSTGSRHVFWLPLACNPGAHYPVDVEEDADIAFAGNTSLAADLERRERLLALARQFRVRIDESVYGDDLCRAVCRGRLAFNSSIFQDVNMRVFEAMAMGRCLLTNRDAAANGLLDLFEEGKHLVAYDDEDMPERAAAYLEDPEARRAIGRAARDEVLAKHTYLHRADSLLETIARHAPASGPTGGSLFRSDESLKTYVPAAPGVLVDIGLGLDASKYAMRRQGVTRFIGVARTAAEAEQRCGSYDAISTWPGEDPLRDNAGTLLWSHPSAFGLTVAEAAAHAHAMLCEGGTFVLRLNHHEACEVHPEANQDAFTHKLRAWDFHLLYARQTITMAGSAPSAPIFALVARKRTRSVADVALEVFARHPSPGMPLDELRRSAQDWPPEMQ